MVLPWVGLAAMVAVLPFYAASGLVDGRLLLALVAGGAVGVAAGARLAPGLARKALLARRVFATMVIATASYVLWRAVAA